MPATNPSAGRILDQILDGAAAALRGDHQRAILDEGAGVAQVVNILARSALMGLAAPSNCLGPRIIEAERMPFLNFFQVVAYVIEIDFLRLRSLRDAHISLFDERERMPLEHRIAFVHSDRPYDPADLRVDDVLHLHRFHNEKLLAAMNAVALGHIERNDSALHRRGNCDRTLGSGDV